LNTALNIQQFGPLGSILDVAPGLTINASSIFVGAPTRVIVSGGTLSSSGSITIGSFAELQLAGDTALLSSFSSINNSGLIHGNGLILAGSMINLSGGVIRASSGERTVFNNLDNTGTVSLLGGEIN